MKKILIISAWSLFGIGLVVSLAFAGRTNASRKCEKIVVTIDRNGTDMFIVEEDIPKMLTDHGMNPVDQPISSINIPALEKLVLTHPAVESCEVFMDINGNVNVQLKQRSAMARVINSNGESYYFDDRGFLMPWSEEYTAPVILVNGNITETYASAYQTDFDNSIPDSVLTSPTKLDDAWQVIRKIEADTFLKAQIVQIYFSADNGMELIPRIGSQAIIIGDAGDLDEKLNKLKIFYREGLGKTGKWNDYKTINLQYKNQVVCTKK
ncbi:MAG TPA: hypothetical protein VL651_15385 [Bacteroidia bacterium]|jgi:cell division protein FtsQ|nr:hypothetical protein [Bacteroidia bacterium]